MKRVLFNGATGGLGQFLGPALKEVSLPATVLTSRLGRAPDIEREWLKVNAEKDDEVTLVPLAALVPVPVCEKEPARAHQTNVTDTVSLTANFLEWARAKEVRARVLYVSTGHVYAPKSPGERLKETDSLAPRSVYAKTKLEAEEKLAALFKGQEENFKIARVFGLLSAAQIDSYVLPSLIKRVLDDDFRGVPGLSCVRDYLDARDVCRLLAKLCALDWRGEPLRRWTILNVCSGEGLSIKELLNHVLAVAEADAEVVYEGLTESPPRPDDIPWMVGDSSRISAILLNPLRSIPIRQTVNEAYENIRLKRALT